MIANEGNFNDFRSLNKRFEKREKKVISILNTCNFSTHTS